MTNEEKLKIIADAIDEGFEVVLYKHDVKYDHLNYTLGIFEGMESTTKDLGDKNSIITRVNGSNQHTDELTANIFS